MTYTDCWDKVIRINCQTTGRIVRWRRAGWSVVLVVQICVVDVGEHIN